jgi:integrase
MGSATSHRRVRVERGIYVQPNGNYAVCCRHAGRLRFRTVGSEIGEARRQRAALIAAVRRGLVPVSPRLRFDTVAGWWLERFEAKVAAGERHARTLEAHRYQLDRHLLPAFAARRVASITADDVAELVVALRGKGCSAKTSAGTLATLQSIMRYARRHGWIAANPVDELEPDERPRPARRRQRVLGRDEIERLLAACSSRDRMMVATVLYTGLRLSEMLGLIWDDIDLAAGVIHVRAQLSRAHRDAPARRVPPKTIASIRHIPLVAQLARLLAAHKQATPPAAGRDWVFTTANGTPHGHRNVTQRGLQRAAPDRGAQPRRLAAVALSRPASHLRQPSHPRPRTRRRAGQPHPRSRTQHRHARRLHAPLRRRPPRSRDPHAHDSKPIRRATRQQHRSRLPGAATAVGKSAGQSSSDRQVPLIASVQSLELIWRRAETTLRITGALVHRPDEHPARDGAAVLSLTVGSGRDVGTGRETTADRPKRALARASPTHLLPCTGRLDRWRGGRRAREGARGWADRAAERIWRRGVVLALPPWARERLEGPGVVPGYLDGA